MGCTVGVPNEDTDVRHEMSIMAQTIPEAPEKESSAEPSPPPPPPASGPTSSGPTSPPPAIGPTSPSAGGPTAPPAIGPTSPPSANGPTAPPASGPTAPPASGPTSPPPAREPTSGEKVASLLENVKIGGQRCGVSFGLYGSNSKYTLGALANAELVPKIYPGWDAVFYVDPATVPADIIAQLVKLGAKVISDAPYKGTMFARFLIADDPNYDRFLIRDVDSRLENREKAAVDDWIKSGMPMHNIRDHPWHSTWVMGGLWGGTKGFLKGTTMLKLVGGWRHGHEGKGPDQHFLQESVLPVVGRENMLTHDTFLRHMYSGSIPFPNDTPPRLSDKDFVGQVYELNPQNQFCPIYDIHCHKFN